MSIYKPMDLDHFTICEKLSDVVPMSGQGWLTGYIAGPSLAQHRDSVRLVFAGAGLKTIFVSLNALNIYTEPLK